MKDFKETLDEVKASVEKGRIGQFEISKLENMAETFKEIQTKYAGSISNYETSQFTYEPKNKRKDDIKMETIFIAQPDITKGKLQETLEDIDNLISNLGGTLDKVDVMGRKNLAYEIKGNKQGFYVVLNWHGLHSHESNVETLLRTNNDIIKFMTIKVED